MYPTEALYLIVLHMGELLLLGKHLWTNLIICLPGKERLIMMQTEISKTKMKFARNSQEDIQLSLLAFSLCSAIMAFVTDFS